MIAKGADVNVQEENSGYSPLYLASTLNQVRYIQIWNGTVYIACFRIAMLLRLRCCYKGSQRHLYT